MSVKTIFWENRLTKMIRKPGGVTLEQALTRGESNLESIKDRCRDALDEKLAGLKALALQPADTDRAAAQSALYDLGNDIIGLAQPAGFPQIGAAAYSLCDLIDCMNARQTDAWSSVAIHVESISLLRGPLAEDQAGGEVILDGLSKLLGRLKPPAPPAAAAAAAAVDP